MAGKGRKKMTETAQKTHVRFYWKLLDKEHYCVYAVYYDSKREGLHSYYLGRTENIETDRIIPILNLEEQFYLPGYYCLPDVIIQITEYLKQHAIEEEGCHD